MNGKLEITFLGTGTSQGVPVIACKCHVCMSDDFKDVRLRSSIMFRLNHENYIIDTGPDFRQQMLVNKVDSVKAILYTHEHKDHVAGMDDVRAFNFIEKRDMEVYCSAAVEKALHREFFYVFTENKYPGVPSVKINLIENRPFYLGSNKIVPVEVMHYKMPVFGFRIDDFTYITDAKTISEEERVKIRGCKVLVVNALRKEEHISHFNLEQALELLEELKPKQALLTHISHYMGLHDEVNKELPAYVNLAYDGQVIHLNE